MRIIPSFIRVNPCSSVAKILFLFFCAWTFSVSAAESGGSVIVVYNSLLPESKSVAEHYAERRKVPANQVFGLDLPTTETMTRAEFRDQLQKPLWKKLLEKKLFSINPDIAKKNPNTVQSHLKESKIRYAVLCYGVPLRIAEDPNLAEPNADKVRLELRKNGAAVDSELSLLLPLADQKVALTGFVPNPFYAATNAALLNPTNGILLVARLDGPSAVIARGLVDKAIQAETDGLWGRAYFDARGLTNTESKLGDDWMRGAAQVANRFGFETVLDNKPETFSATFPMSQIALYAGWYDLNVSGPFTRPKVEFMPGAFAYHLHSFSAQTLRSTTEHWCGPLLAAGVTATMGCVDEPYLGGTPDMEMFFNRFLYLGFSFGEAAYAAQNVLSWQTTVVGDPLYRPFGKNPRAQHEDLLKRKSKLIEWSHLRVVDLNIATGGAKLDELVAYLEAEETTKKSAILLEKLGDLYFAQGKPAAANQAYKDALKLEVTPLERARLEQYVANTAEAAAKSTGKK